MLNPKRFIVRATDPDDHSSVLREGEGLILTNGTCYLFHTWDTRNFASIFPSKREMVQTYSDFNVEFDWMDEE